MGNQAGAMNYSLSKVMHMLAIVKKALSKDKIMREAVAMSYKWTKLSHRSERSPKKDQVCVRASPNTCGGWFFTGGAFPSPMSSGHSSGYNHEVHEGFGGYESTGTLPLFELSGDPELVVGSTRGVDEEKEALLSATPTEPANLAPTASARTQVPPAKLTLSKNPSVSSNQSSVLSTAKGITNAGARERIRYPTLLDNLDRLDGINLAEMRDTLKKRTYSEFEEANYTKQKRLIAAVELKRKLNSATHSAPGSGSDLVKTIRISRADADRPEAARDEVAEVIRREEGRAERNYFENRCHLGIDANSHDEKPLEPVTAPEKAYLQGKKITTPAPANDDRQNCLEDESGLKLIIVYESGGVRGGSTSVFIELTTRRTITS
ncbi:unnamed protein product [Phytophthora fragariaefolia]|uniref:Unnamed protein product n=1 Tax=Phytophthora fragariaefolia TaxID=1490495 RepID=A0A9W6WV50_9STRA|nr:unnamed protein product [Phytophthora fragariaefolia]